MSPSTNGNGPVFEAGLHPHMPSHVYHAIDAVSASRLKLLRKSPAHMMHEINNPEEPTPALIIGSATHHLTLERDTFDDHYAIMPKFDRRTSAGKEQYADWCAENRGKTPIDREQFLTAHAVSNALLAHPNVSALLACATQKEVTGIWQDVRTGLMRKMRADALCPEVGTCFDIKTSECAERFEFERSIFKYGYHIQGAQYLDGLAALGMPMKHYVIIVVEKKAPYGIKVYRLRDDIVELGRKEIALLLDLYAKCKAENHWPGYPVGIEDIGLPGYAINHIEREVLA